MFRENQPLVSKNRSNLSAVPSLEPLEDRAVPAQATPVLIVPGFIGSFPSVGDIPNFSFNRGFAPDELYPAYIGTGTFSLDGVYDQLIETFEDQGYTKNQDLFVATYDWRMPLAPFDGEFDGQLTNVTADMITDGGTEYLAQYIGYWLDRVVEANPEATEVDIVAHSFGNLVTRSYIQSDAYGGTYTRDGETRTLPTVRDYVQFAGPNEGTPQVWNLWNNNFYGDLTTQIMASAILGTTYRLVDIPVIGASVSNPDGTVIDRDSIRDPVTGRPSETLFVQQYVPALSSLMATYEFLTLAPGTDPVDVNDTIAANNVTLDMNALSAPGTNPWVSNLTGFGAQFGVTDTTPTGATAEQGVGGLVFPITNIIPRATRPGEDYFNTTYTSYDPTTIDPVGDGTLTFRSMSTTFLGDPDVALKIWYGEGSLRNSDDSVGHVDLVSNPDALAWMLEQFGMGETAALDTPATEEDPIEDYFGQIFRQVLARDADHSELQAYAAEFEAGRTRSELVTQIVMSEESIGNIVDMSYLTILGRASDAPGRAGWIAAIRDGMSKEEFEARMLASEEYRARFENDRDWLASLYWNTLGRLPEEVELDSWSEALGRQDYVAITTSFIDSTEFLIDVAQTLFDDQLRRDGSPLEIDLLATALKEALVDELDAAIDMLASPESFALRS
ncbi:PGAP1-like protein [Planctomycetes bacterium Pan216]|uniref:PGAP1-like protein n=1 Tax=Kolteria novifilia TaxID=2527975 RepID=A0A518B1E4_9BACT|nr:PGAP1-like protein [Planctomycetes bacterium Pan216]